MNTHPSALLLASLSALGATAEDVRPNIVLFLVDDMGWQDTSVPFWSARTPLNARYRTPNMERMARLGVKFTNAYACPVSSPSRCSLLSGMNAARHRVTNWVARRDEFTDEAGASVKLPAWHCNGIQPAEGMSEADRHLSTPVTALPQLLREAGYYTIHCGKGNFASEGTAGANPLNFGYDVNITGSAAGAPASYLAQENYGKGFFHVSGLEAYYERGTFLTEALTLEAKKAMQKPISEHKPFFLYLAHYAIHTPYNADARFTPHYMEGGEGIYDAQLGARLNQQEVNRAALLEGMDKSLGDVLDYLEEQGIADNTIVLFMSDNGGHSVWPRQGRLNIDPNFPARAGKGSAYEGGVREPMMVVWPGVVEGGTQNAGRVMIEDFFPTILELAGITSAPTVQTVDGHSFAELLRNPMQQRERTCVFHFPNRWREADNESEGYGTYSALISGSYKLIYFWESQRLRLYNLAADISEQHDLSDALRQTTLPALARELTDSLISYDAQRPLDKQTSKPIAWPDGRE